MNRLTPSAYPERLTTIRIYEVQFQNFPSPAGGSIRLIAFADPSGSGASPQRNPTLLVNQTVTLPALPQGGGGFVNFSVANGPVVTSVRAEPRGRRGLRL